MKVEDFLTGAGKYCMGTIVAGSLGACAGYTYGTLASVNPLLAAQTLGIAAVAAFIFRQCVENGLDDMRDSSRNFIYILGTTFGGATFILALKNLEIISKVGTAILGTLFVVFNGIAIGTHIQGEHIFT